MEQRENMKFCSKTCKTATETFQLIKQVYGDNNFSYTQVFERYTRFQDRCENLEDDKCSG
jgi:hypothetical protein